MRIIYLAALLAIIAGSCTTQPKTKYLNESALPHQVFKIDITRDTVLKTSSGSIITIAANSISSPFTTVEFEVKEALDMGAILTAGLVTMSGKNVLSSGGMIYLNTVTPNAQIVKPIKVQIPTDEIVSGMSAWRGNIAESQIIDWERKPEPEHVTQADSIILRGKSLFKANCASCHNPIVAGTGPALAGISNRRSKEWIYRFTRNWNELVNEGDCEAIEESNYSPSQMNLFPGLSDEDIDAILYYADSSFRDTNTKGPFCYDLCKDNRKKFKKIKREASKIKATKAVEVNYYDKLPDGTYEESKGEPLGGDKSFVTETNHTSLYYAITIDAWGWYNIDVMLQELSNLIDAKLIVDVPGFDESNLTISLIIPEVKCFTNGGLLDNEKTKYGFMERDGRIKLPAGADAYILAYGDVKGKFMLAYQQFVVKENNAFVLQMKPADPADLKKHIATISRNEIETKVKKLASGQKLDKLNAQIDKLKNKENLPDDCDCFCTTDNTDTIHY